MVKYNVKSPFPYVKSPELEIDWFRNFGNLLHQPPFTCGISLHQLVPQSCCLELGLLWPRSPARCCQVVAATMPGTTAQVFARSLRAMVSHGEICTTHDSGWDLTSNKTCDEKYWFFIGLPRIQWRLPSGNQRKSPIDTYFNGNTIYELQIYSLVY
jgi:hypothetical protein